jgi:uncharacterized protein (TIGR00251 family)
MRVHELLAKRLGEGRAFRVKVIPKSARTEITGELADGTLKIRVAAVPEKGRANAELCAFIARELGLPASSIEVISGQTSPVKLVKVSSR